MINHSIDTVKKSMEPDNIPVWVLGDNASVLAPPLTALFIAGGCNTSDVENHTRNTITQKRPHRLVENNIRPISITPIMSKTLKSVIMTLVDTVLEDTINDNQ